MISCTHVLTGVPIDALRISAMPSSDATPAGGAGAAAIEGAANSFTVTVCTIMPVDLPELAVLDTEKVASDGADASPLFPSMLFMSPTIRLITCRWLDPPVQRDTFGLTVPVAETMKLTAVTMMLYCFSIREHYRFSYRVGSLSQ